MNIPKCKYCGKEYSWEEAKKLEETLKGCRFYCSLKCCWLAHPNPEENLKMPVFLGRDENDSFPFK